MAEVKVIIRNTVEGLRQIAQQGEQWKSFKSTIGQVTGALGLVSAGFVATWKVAEQGAALELSADRFDKLTASIGTTSAALMGELGAATGDMMTNAQMMASASQIISLGLADTQEGVVDLASLVSELGWDMSQVILTFANNSKMRLDALGLSVTDVEERMAELEAQGYDTDKAFDMAVIQAGQAKLELLGSAAGTSAGGMKELAANIGDMVDGLKIAVSDGIQPSIDALNILFDVANNGGDVISGIVDANIEQAQGVGDLVEQYKRLDAQLGLGSSFTGTSTDLRDNMEKVQAQILNTAGSVDEWTSALVAMGIANKWQISLHKESYAAAFEQAQVDKAAAAALEEYTRWTEANTAANKRMAGQYSMTTTATEDLTMSVADMNYHQEEAYEGMISSTAVLEDNAMALEDHAASVAIVRGEYETAVGVMQSFSTTVSEGYGAAALAAEDSQARQITANDAISESYKQTALNVFSSKLAETIQEDGLGAANAMIAYQQALGLITPEEAAKLEEVALKTEAITDATGALFDAYMSDGVLTRGEMDLMAEAVRSIDEGTALMSDTIIKTAAEDIPKLVGLHQETATFDEKLGNASVSAGTLKDSLDALPTRLDIDVYINTHGSVPDTGGAPGGGGATGSGGAPSGSPGGNGPGPGGSYASGTGGWVTVPPGYPNDTYNARLTSGEQFAVIPAGGGKAGMGAITNNFYIHGNDPQQIAQEVGVILARQARLNKAARI